MSDNKLFAAIWGIIALLIAVIFVRNTPASKKYHNDLMRSYYNVDRKVESFLDAIKNREMTKMGTNYDELLKQCNESIRFVKKRGAFEEEVEFQKKSLALLEFYKEVTVKEFQEILDIFLNSEDQIDPENLSRINEMTADIRKRRIAYVSKFLEVSSLFRNKYNISIVVLTTNEALLLAAIFFMLWVLPVKFIGGFFQAQRNGVFLCSGAVAISVAFAHATSLIATKYDFLHFDYTIIIKVLLAMVVFKFFMGTTYWKGLALSLIFWACVFISTYYVYVMIYG